MTKKIFKIRVDMEKILLMPNDVLAHKLDIDKISAARVKSAIRELTYIL